MTKEIVPEKSYPIGLPENLDVFENDPNDHPIDWKSVQSRINGEQYVDTNDIRSTLDFKESMEFHARRRQREAQLQTQSPLGNGIILSDG